ncbi:MAG: FkbM family methyltransferase [Clostridia bacterium]
MSPELKAHVELVQGRHGRFYVLDTDQYVSRSLKTYGEWTENEVELLCQVLRPGDAAIDAGANLGSHTVPFARRVGPAGRVMAFEPQPRIFELLSANVSINGLGNVTLHPAACGAEAGQLDLPPVDYGREANFGGVNVRDLEAAGRNAGLATVPVPLVTLDDAVKAEHVRLIKIDVEGMERDVLQGARRLIEKGRPFLYVENESPEQSPALLQAVQDLGYAPYWHVVPFFDADNSRGVTEDIFSGMGCVNVLCVPRELNVDLRGLPAVRSISEHPRSPA